MATPVPPFQHSRLPNAFFSVSKRLIRLRGRPLDVSRLGANWRLYPRDWIDNRLIVGRPYEHDQLNYMFRLIAEMELDTVIDCGANIGLYAVLAGVHAASVREIHAFEPVPATFQRLSHHVRANELDDKVTCHETALSDHRGTFEMQFDPNSTGVSTMSESMATAQGRKFIDVLEVHAVRLDDVLSLEGRKLFIKIDVEGHALAVLGGMPDLLANNRAVLQIEESGDDDIIRERLEAAGFHRFHEIDAERYFTNLPR
ncbi:MAG: FkbM family methyltransferase [Hyphomicrobiaceae bacterium]